MLRRLASRLLARRVSRSRQREVELGVDRQIFPVQPPVATPPRPLPVANSAVADPRLSGSVVLVGTGSLLAGLQPRGRPVLVHHWASWDDLSTKGLAAVVALAGPTPPFDVVGVAWDEFLDAPMGRIAGMAQRPARWAGGDQVEAWVRQAGITWSTLVFGDPPEMLFETLGITDRWVPSVTLYGVDGSVLAHHGGPCEGEGWDRFVADSSVAAADSTGNS